MPPKPKRYGIPPTQFRLTAEELAEADAIAKELGLSNRTAAVRYSLKQTAKKLKLTIPAPDDSPQSASGASR